MELYENQADRLGYNLRLNEILYLPFSSFTSQKKQNSVRSSCKSTLWLTP